MSYTNVDPNYADTPFYDLAHCAYMSTSTKLWSSEACSTEEFPFVCMKDSVSEVIVDDTSGQC